MSANTTQKQAAKQFVRDWSGRGYEKGETQRFWIALLQNVFGIPDATKFVEFELPVKTILKEKGSDFIDGYIPSTKVLIEQKGSKVDIGAKYRQSDGSELTPYQQARRYANASGEGMPENTDFEALRDNCDHTWITIAGVNGYVVIDKTTKDYMFLPASGYDGGSSWAGENGYYWSRTEEDSEYAWSLTFDNYVLSVAGGDGKTNELSVRPLKK